MGTIKNKVYILHGWSYSTEKWQPFLDLLEKEVVEVKMLKIPGLTAPLKRVFDLDDYVDWLDREIAEKGVLLGHSNGGRIAIAYASKHPEKVKSLILLDSAGLKDTSLKHVLKTTLFKNASKLAGKAVKSKGIKKLLYKAIGEKDYNEAEGFTKQTMVNLISKDLTQELSKLNLPTLIIWGEKDRITPLSMGRKMHSQIKNSRLEVIENARHAPHFTSPERISDTVISFLKNL